MKPDIEAALTSDSAMTPRTENKLLEDLRNDAAEAFAAFDRGEGVVMTPDELMDSIRLG